MPDGHGRRLGHAFRKPKTNSLNHGGRDEGGTSTSFKSEDTSEYFLQSGQMSGNGLVTQHCQFLETMFW